MHVVITTNLRYECGQWLGNRGLHLVGHAPYIISLMRGMHTPVHVSGTALVWYMYWSPKFLLGVSLYLLM